MTNGIVDIYGLSPSQQGILVQALKDPGSGVYFNQHGMTLRGALDESAFAEAWALACRRHEVLRTSFHWKKQAEPLQVVRERVELPFRCLDWRRVPAGEQRVRLEDVLRQEREGGFDMERPPLLRVHLFRLADEVYRFVCSSHHIILDGWSRSRLFGDVLANYNGLLAGQPPRSTGRPYKDFIDWLRGRDMAAAEAFWRRALSGPVPPLPPLPTVTAGKEELRKELSAEETAALERFCRDRKLTLSTLAHGAWALVLSRRREGGDVVLGTVVSGRPAEIAGIEDMVGLFINTLPVRVRAAGDERAGDWLAGLQETLVDTRRFEYSPLARVQEWGGAANGAPLFDSILAFENFPFDGALADAGVGLRIEDIRSHDHTNYPLAATVLPGRRLSIRVVGDAGLYDSGSISRMAQHWRELLLAIAAGPERRLAELCPAGAGELAAAPRDAASRSRTPQTAAWRRLEGAPPLLELPLDRPRTPARPYAAGGRRFAIPRRCRAAVEALAERAEASTFAVLLAAFKVLLHRYTRQDDMVVGTRAGADGAADLLALRTDLSGDPAFADLVGRVHAGVLAARAGRGVPFAEALDALGVERDPGYHPLFQVMFTLGDGPAAGSHGAPGLDLSLRVRDAGGEWSGSVEYNAAILDAGTVDEMVRNIVVLLDALAEDCGVRMSRLPVIDEEERRRLLGLWGAGASQGGEERSLVDLFEARVDSGPDAVAVVCEGAALSYGELNRRANRLARHLRALGVGTGGRVGVYLDRSIDLVVGLLGVLKAGAAYVPVDSAVPAERRAFILADADVPVLLTSQALAPGLEGSTARRVCLDADAGAINRRSGANLETRVAGGDLAYAIYTSGSTGKPKGVLVEHANVTRLFAATEGQFGFGAQDVWTLFHSYAFDFSVWELWGALLYGGRLVVVPHLTSRSPDAFYALLCRERVSVLNQTPSAFKQLIRAERKAGGGSPSHALRKVILGGEALDPGALGPWWDRHGEAGPQVVNMYGITETTVHVTYRPLSAADVERGHGSPIGGPIGDLQLYLLDANLNPPPRGALGELYVGGAGVARGYLGRPGLTADRFVPDAFSGSPGARLYRTGDLARATPDGDLDYGGRMDQQVQVRGFRVELGEIAAVLNEHPEVGEAVVVPRPDEGGQVQLSAYAVGAGPTPPSAGEMRRFLRERLPEYMVPAHFVALGALPLTANGKLDTRALPAPDSARPELGSGFVEPRGEWENAIAGIWKDVLRVDDIGAADNFFDLGGNSISMLQVHGHLEQLVQGELAVVALFEHPTVRSLAGHLQGGGEAGHGEPGPPQRRVTGRKRRRETRRSTMRA